MSTRRCFHSWSNICSLFLFYRCPNIILMFLYSSTLSTYSPVTHSSCSPLFRMLLRGNSYPCKKTWRDHRRVHEEFFINYVFYYYFCEIISNVNGSSIFFHFSQAIYEQKIQIKYKYYIVSYGQYSSKDIRQQSIWESRGKSRGEPTQSCLVESLLRAS